MTPTDPVPPAAAAADDAEMEDEEERKARPLIAGDRPGWPGDTEVEKHNRRHVVHHAWYEYCEKGRGSHAQRRRRAVIERVYPVLSVDYGSFTRTDIVYEDEQVIIMTGYDRDLKAFVAIMVKVSGKDSCVSSLARRWR